MNCGEFRTPEGSDLVDQLKAAGVEVVHLEGRDQYALEHGGLPAYMVAGELIEDLAFHLGAEGGALFVLEVKRPWDRDKILAWRREHGGPVHD